MYITRAGFVLELSMKRSRFDWQVSPLSYRRARSRAAALKLDDELAAFSAALVMASPTGVIVPLAGCDGCGGVGPGVPALEGAAERLCCMCALTRWPAAKALHRESSPASVAAAMMRARRREFSPALVGCGPRTPSMSSMALWGSRMVPPPRVPTSMEGMETEIWREPRRLANMLAKTFEVGRAWP